MPTQQPTAIRLYDRNFELLWSGTPEQLADYLREQAAQLKPARRFNAHVMIDGPLDPNIAGSADV